VEKLYTNWFPRQTAVTLARLRAVSLYPALNAPQFNQHGGAVTNGFALSITHSNPAGTVYFTTDGTDPRVYGTGAVAPGASPEAGPIPVLAPILVRSRVFHAGQWSALTEAHLFPGDLSDLDEDGLPDWWELLHQTDVNAPDADADPDQDGLTNGEEFRAGTDPQSAASTLKMEASLAVSGEVVLRFFAVSNRNYRVLFKETVASSEWAELSSFTAATTNRWVILQNSPGEDASRFYTLTVQ
jgi:hypothetical protein